MAAEAAIGGSYRWVNAVRGLTRPVLTLTLCGITGLVYIGADALVVRRPGAEGMVREEGGGMTWRAPFCRHARQVLPAWEPISGLFGRTVRRWSSCHRT